MKIKCCICNCEFSKYGIDNHIKTHKISVKAYYDSYIKSENEGKCKTCGKPTDFLTIHSGYKAHCCKHCADNDPEIKDRIKETTTTKYGAVGFASETLLEKSRSTYKEKTGFECPAANPTVMQTILEKRERTWNEKYGVKHVMQNPEIAKKTKKKYQFDDRMFDSSWELAYYVWLKDHHIAFNFQPHIAYHYSFNDVEHTYEPDFLVEGQLVEIKGDHFFENGKMICPWNHAEDDKYEAKHQCMLKHNVKILSSSDIKFCFEYVNRKYGNNFFDKLKIQKEKT